jgi:hypothetical protein
MPATLKHEGQERKLKGTTVIAFQRRARLCIVSGRCSSSEGPSDIAYCPMGLKNAPKKPAPSHTDVFHTTPSKKKNAKNAGLLQVVPGLEPGIREIIILICSQNPLRRTSASVGVAGEENWEGKKGE